MIQWTEQTAQQLIALSSSEEVAARVTMRIVSSIQQLTAFLMSGRAGRVPGTRELAIRDTPFLASYAVEKADIVVLAIYHGAQRRPKGFLSLRSPVAV